MTSTCRTLSTVCNNGRCDCTHQNTKHQDCPFLRSVLVKVIYPSFFRCPKPFAPMPIIVGSLLGSPASCEFMQIRVEVRATRIKAISLGTWMRRTRCASKVVVRGYYLLKACMGLIAWQTSTMVRIWVVISHQLIVWGRLDLASILYRDNCEVIGLHRAFI